MILKFGDDEFEIKDFEKLEGKISNSTDKEIEKINFNINFMGKQLKDNFLNVLKSKYKDNVYSLDEVGKIIKKYKVSNHTCSYTGNIINENTVFNFSVDLEEIEKLKIASLIISGKEFYPYEYSENFDDGFLMIFAKVKLSSDQIKKMLIEKIKKDDKYFPVIRKGINDKEKLMRFGTVFWSKNNDDYKYDIVLVEKKCDEIGMFKDKDNFWIKNSNLEHLVAYNNNYLDELIKLLINKKILSEKEVEIIKNKSKEKELEKVIDLYKVDDID